MFVQERVGAVPGLEADVSAYFEVPGADDEGGATSETAIHARRGPVVVDLRTWGGGLGTSDHVRIVEAVLDRVARATSP